MKQYNVISGILCAVAGFGVAMFALDSYVLHDDHAAIRDVATMTFCALQLAVRRPLFK